MSEPHQVNNYDGPVIHGAVSNSQFAWNNERVDQKQQNNSAVAPGYEALAALVRDLLRQLPRAGLAPQDREDTEAAAQEVLDEITGGEAPEPGRFRRALNGLRGALAPVAAGAAAGATAGAEEWAQEAIRSLTSLV
ncbi:hypothetical protein ACFY1L_04075 [Streptomyces sp. NPDC001663]|uniref:hypothetical protein n=1 Tax=Streptomyces sp. NPDC001663 TaxID=3364597 RepID=UPI0036AFBC75